MFFQEPQPTPYDVCFSIFGIPVRVHPFHWLLGAILGAMAGRGGGDLVPIMLICMFVVFVSILIHELGHSFAMRFYGQASRISLYWLGGLAIPEESWSRSASRSSLQQVVISFAGPAAGFMLAGLTFVLCLAAGFIDWDYYTGFFPFAIFSGNSLLDNLLWILLYVNVFWGVINLIPVFPLDGGQISRAVFTHFDPHRGLEQSLWLSVISGGFAALVGIAVFKMIFMAIMFGMMAFQSFQMIQNIRTGGFGGGGFGRGPW